MSENSIDVDVNFHLNEIDKIFEKIMEGTSKDIFKDLSNINELDDEGMASLLKDISSVDDKTKLLESFTNLGIHTSIINDIHKIVEEMEADQDEDSTIIERTQNSMMTLLALSKTMMKLFEDKIPITANMQKELDKMNKTLSNQNLELDEKLEVLKRSIANIFAPFKEERQAFKVTPSKAPTFLNVIGKDKAIGQIDTILDFVNQVSDDLRETIDKVEKGSGQLRLKHKLSKLDNLFDIGANVTDILNEFRGLLAEEQENTRQLLRFRESDPTSIPAGMFMTTPQGKEFLKAMKTIETTMKSVSELFEGIGVQIDTHLLNLQTNIEEVVQANEERLLELQSAIELLNVSAGGIIELKDYLKTVIGKGMIDLKNILEVEFFERTLIELVNKLIEEKLMQPVEGSTTARQLQYILTIAEAALNTLGDDLARLLKGKSYEELEALGLINVSAVGRTIESTRKQQLNVHESLKIKRLPEFNLEGMDVLDTNMLSDMFQQIQSTEQQTKIHMGKLSEDMKLMLQVVEGTRTIASETKISADQMSKNINTVVNRVKEAGDQMLSAKKSMNETNEKVNQVIQRFTEDNPGNDIDPLDL